MVKWVSEDKLDPKTGEKQSWEVRNKGYLERLKTAPKNVRALSCADKTSNMRDMNRLLAKGHPTSAFTKGGFKFEVQRMGVILCSAFPPRRIPRAAI